MPVERAGEQVGGLVHELDDVQFSTKMRGYDPTEVDALLDRARRAIEELRSSERRAAERATLAERQLEEELEAARTARVTAEAGIATATAEAARIVADARLEAADLREAAEIEIRGAAADARSRMLAEIADLELQRDGVLEQIDVTAAHLAAHQTRLRRAVADLATLVDGIAERPEGVGGEAEAAHPEPTPLRPAASDGWIPGIAHTATAESALLEPGWAVDDHATEVVRPIRSAVPRGVPPVVGTGGAVGGDEGDLEAFFADDGS